MDYEELRRKYVERLQQELTGHRTQLTTRHYDEFRKQYLPKRLSLYEKACNISEKTLSIAPDKKKLPELQAAIETCHLQVTLKGVASFALLAPLTVILTSLFLFFVMPAFLGSEPQMFFVLFFIITAMVMYVPLTNLPLTLAANWRMKASNQMVLCIFYIVTYMHHTSNLERALDFAAEHLGPPLALDMKKVLWDVETEKYASVRESLDRYLLGWKTTNMEFIESLHLIEGSLLESSEARRIEMLDKSLSVMLEETYEKMLHYAHDLKSPLTTLHMLGIILPILGLVILPLMVSFMDGVRWYQILMIYNVALPIGVYLLGKSMLSKRPSGYGDVDITEMNPELKKRRGLRLAKNLSFGAFPIAVFIFIILFIGGISPLLYHVFNPESDIALDIDSRIRTIDYKDPEQLKESKFFFLGYREQLIEGRPTGRWIGPFGIGATVISCLVPLAFGLAIGVYFRIRSGNVIKLRQETKRLEQEFAGALLQLGNRLADGLPAEIAFSKVADVMVGTETGRFFELVSINIAKLGMSVEQAIFDQKHGALHEYPSSVIESSMKVLVESSRKGPLIASQAIINVSEYIKQMHRVDERLKDLMADVISSMKSQVNFLTPAIAGIVIGITSMITKIMGTLAITINTIGASSSGQVAEYQGILKIFGSGSVPTYFFQIIVGLYVVQLAYILTLLVNGIENGADRLGEEELLGKSMVNSTLLYVGIAVVIIILFNIIAGTIINRSF